MPRNINTRSSSDREREMPDAVRRRDDASYDPGGISRDPNLIPEIRETDDIAGISPSPDGGNADHPIHDEDFNDDFGSDDYEDLADDAERAEPETMDDDEPAVE